MRQNTMKFLKTDYADPDNPIETVVEAESLTDALDTACDQVIDEGLLSSPHGATVSECLVRYGNAIKFEPLDGGSYTILEMKEL